MLCSYEEYVTWNQITFYQDFLPRAVIKALYLVICLPIQTTDFSILL